MKLIYLTVGFLASTAIARTTFVPSNDACDTKDFCELEKKDDWSSLDSKATLKKRIPQTPPPPTKPAPPDPKKKKPPPPPPPKNAAAPPPPPPDKKKDPKKPKKKKPPPPPTGPPPPQLGDPCQTEYKLCQKPKDPKLQVDPKGKKYSPKQLEHKCGCALQACVGEDNARGREYCDKLQKANWIDTDAGEKPPPTNSRVQFGGRDNKWTWKNGQWIQE